ncbi:hypothetical protein HT031_005065 [Scenedesmus sp. PABB004]|nr:hypothetical protein HT031_005065 [Scenedesmus sp. PABB004]
MSACSQSLYSGGFGGSGGALWQGGQAGGWGGGVATQVCGGAKAAHGYGGGAYCGVSPGSYSSGGGFAGAAAPPSALLDGALAAAMSGGGGGGLGGGLGGGHSASPLGREAAGMAISPLAARAQEAHARARAAAHAEAAHAHAAAQAQAAAAAAVAEAEATSMLYGHFRSRQVAQQPHGAPTARGRGDGAAAAAHQRALDHQAVLLARQQAALQRQQAEAAAGAAALARARAAAAAAAQEHAAALAAARACAPRSVAAGPSGASSGSQLSDATRMCAMYGSCKTSAQQQQQQQLHAQQQQLWAGAGGPAARLPPRPAPARGGGAWAGRAPGAAAAAPPAPAAPGRAWAVLEAPRAGSLDSDAGSGGLALECDEDLMLSLEPDAATGPAPAPWGRSVWGGRARDAPGAAAAPPPRYEFDTRELEAELCELIEDSGSTASRSEGCFPSDDMQDDEEEEEELEAARGGGMARADGAALVAARAAAVAAQQAAAAKQSVLGRVGAQRKGAAVLTAPPSAAAAAGAASARRRLLVTEVSVYADAACASGLALEQANRLLARMALPDGVAFRPVRTDGFLFKAGAAWQFPAFVIALGCSYLQRMLARLPQLADAAAACPGFEEYAPPPPPPAHRLREPGRAPSARLAGAEAASTLATLRSVQFTCLFLATKVADQVHALGLLRFMLTQLSHNGAVVSAAQAADVEARCLDALGWRLGPFFIEDALTGDDEELWAEAMGHWHYGTSADSYPETY